MGRLVLLAAAAALALCGNALRNAPKPSIALVVVSETPLVQRTERIVPAEQDALIEQFRHLSSENQISAYKEICERADQETGMGAVYRRIINHANARRLTIAELENEAKTNRDAALAFSHYKNLQHSPSSYSPSFYSVSLDAIITPPMNLVDAFGTLVTTGCTAQALLAHESTHKEQNDSNPYKVSMKRSKRTLQEVAAHLLTPQIAAVTNGFELKIPAALTQSRNAGGYGFDVKQCTDAQSGVVTLYGVFQGNDAYTRVNEYVGKHGETIAGFKSAIAKDFPDHQMREQNGKEVIYERAKRLEQVPDI